MAQKKTKSKGRPYAPAPKNTGLKVLSLLLAALFIAAGIGCAVGWVKVSKLEKQINSQLPSDGDNTGNEEGGGSLVVKPSLTCDSISLDVQPYSDEGAFFITETEEDGSVSYVSAEGICSITATVYDINGSVNEELQSVTWEISNAEAGVTMTVDGMTATFECVPEGFSEQIIVTCTSTIDPEKFETITLDYAKGIGSIQCQFQGDISLYNTLRTPPLAESPIIKINFNETKTGTNIPTYSSNSEVDLFFAKYFRVEGKGSIQDEVKKISFEVCYSEEFKQIALKAMNDNSEGRYSAIDESAFNTIIKTFDLEGLAISEIRDLLNTGGLSIFDILKNDSGLFKLDYSIWYAPDLYSPYVSSFYGLENQIEVAITFDLKYRGEVTYNYAVTVVLDNYSPIGSVSTGGNNSVIFH